MSLIEGEQPKILDALSIEALIEAARAGSREALGELLERCRGQLTLLARRQLSQRVRVKEAVSDVVQETCLDAQQGLAAFRGQSQEELLAWLRQILLHCVAETNRRYTGTRKRSIAAELFSIELGSDRWHAHAVRTTDTPSASLAAQERYERIGQTLDDLPEDYRQVLALRHRRRLTFAEVARRMGRSEEAVRQLWSRAITKLQRKLRESDGEEEKRS